MSLFPSLGLNIEFLGGSDIDGYAFNPQILGVFGRYYLRRLDEATQPSTLVSFASARGPTDQYPPGASDPTGYFRLRPPAMFAPIWAQSWSAAASGPAQTGFVDFRHRGRAVVTHLDGHASALSFDELRDMRRWWSRAGSRDAIITP